MATHGLTGKDGQTPLTLPQENKPNQSFKAHTRGKHPKPDVWPYLLPSSTEVVQAQQANVTQIIRNVTVKIPGDAEQLCGKGMTWGSYEMSNNSSMDMSTSINLDKLDEAKISTTIEDAIKTKVNNSSESTKEGLLAIGDKNSSTQQFELNTMTKNTIRDVVKKSISTIQKQEANKTQIMEGMTLDAPCVVKGSTRTLQYGNNSVVKQVATTISKDVTQRLADMVNKKTVDTETSNKADTKVKGLDAVAADMITGVVSSLMAGAVGVWIVVGLLILGAVWVVVRMFSGGGGGGGKKRNKKRKHSDSYDVLWRSDDYD